MPLFLNVFSTFNMFPNVNDHLKNHDDENWDDFIHAYLKEMRRRQQKQETTTLDCTFDLVLRYAFGKYIYVVLSIVSMLRILVFCISYQERVCVCVCE